jgi:uncharacterized protein YbbC (DUF1343 family)
MFFNREFGIGANLVVIPMAGWQASMQWEDTGLAWFRPSPMIPSPTAAQLHAATGVLEGTNLSVGAGASLPFETVTAPGVNGEQLAQRLNAVHLPGVLFVPHTAGSGSRRQGGVRLVIGDPRQLLPATTAVYTMAAVRDLHPGLLRFHRSAYSGRYVFDLVWGTDSVRRALQRGDSAQSIVASWQRGLQQFLGIRQRYLLYPRTPMTVVQTPPKLVEAQQAAIHAPAPTRAPQTRRPTGCHDRPAVCGGLAGAAVK